MPFQSVRYGREYQFVPYYQYRDASRSPEERKQSLPRGFTYIWTAEGWLYTAVVPTSRQAVVIWLRGCAINYA